MLDFHLDFSHSRGENTRAFFPFQNERLCLCPPPTYDYNRSRFYSKAIHNRILARPTTECWRHDTSLRSSSLFRCIHASTPRLPLASSNARRFLPTHYMHSAAGQEHRSVGGGAFSPLSAITNLLQFVTMIVYLLKARISARDVWDGETHSITEAGDEQEIKKWGEE